MAGWSVIIVAVHRLVQTSPTVYQRRVDQGMAISLSLMAGVAVVHCFLGQYHVPNTARQAMSLMPRLLLVCRAA